MGSRIPYLDETWNPITGCTPISEGCEHCWARAMDARFRGGAHGPAFHEERLDSKQSPFHWRDPRRIGVCFTSDLWHGQIPNEWRHQVYLRMLANRRHTYLLLTKRAGSMCAHVNGAWEPQNHMWHGVTVENQARLEERLPHLINANVAHRWVSAEPLLGPLDFMLGLARVGWLVVGCESGPGARECDLVWIESVVRQCQIAQVPVYVKQIRIGKRIIRDPAQFPRQLRLRQLPEGWK
jgi:protein gp37